MKKIIFILIIALKLFAQYEWSAPVQLSETAQYPDSTYLYPAITVDNNGALHSFWVKNIQIDNDLQWYSQIEYKYSTDGGLNWGITQNLTPEYTDNRIYEIQAICDSLNKVHLFYLRGAEPGKILYKKYNGMYWTEPLEISHYATKRIRPVFDRNGRLYLTWNYALTAYYTFSDLKEDTPVWQEPKAINEGVSLETYLSVYSYVFDSKNRLYAIGTVHNGDYYVPITYQYDSSSDTWHSFDVFDEYTESSNGVEMTISNNDTLYANILVGNMDVNRNYIQKKNVDDTDWSEPVFVNENNTWDYRKLCVDKSYYLHLFEMNFKEFGSRLSYTTDSSSYWEINFYQDDTEHNYAYFNVCFNNDNMFYAVYDKMYLETHLFRIMFQTKQIETGIEEEPGIISDFKLYQNYPNPFNNSTAIKFDIPNDCSVELSIFNSIGEKISTLEDSKMKKGSHEINFNADKFNSGVYYYRLIVNGKVTNVNRMLYLK